MEIIYKAIFALAEFLDELQGRVFVLLWVGREGYEFYFLAVNKLL